MKVLSLISLLFIEIINSAQKDNVDRFLSSSSEYSFKCGCEVGQILSSKLVGDQLTVEYEYPCGGELRKGFLKGTYNRKTNRFTGFYNTENKRFYGEMNFAFNEKGEAIGTWGNGTGKVEMKLRSSVKQS